MEHEPFIDHEVVPPDGWFIVENQKMLNYLGYPNDLGNLHLFLFVCLCGLFMSTGSLPGVGSAQPCSWGSLSAPVA